MSLSDKATRIVARQFLQPLKAFGFVPIDKRSVARARGALIDVIAIQFGRGAESFYLHQHVHVLANVAEVSLLGYRVGRRLDSDPAGSNDWIVSTSNRIDTVLESVASVAVSVSLDYFSAIQDLRDYLVETTADVNYRARMHQFDVAVALAELRRIDRVVQICQETIQTVASSESLEPRMREQVVTAAQRLLSAANHGDIPTLLEEWKAERREKYKLGLLTN